MAQSKVSVLTSLKFVIGVCCLAGCVLAQVGPCTQPPNIMGNSQRSTTYEIEDVPLCDYELDESLWHSFRIGAAEITIPELATVPLRHCGTYGPIFILAKAAGGLTYHEDAKRSATGLTTAKICSNNGGPDAPCDWTEDITIQYCQPTGNNPEFYIYKLKAAPACDLAYCGGIAPTCKVDTAWNAATQTCEPLYPVMTRPTLVGPEIVEEKNIPSCGGNNLVVQRFAFYCDIGYPEQAADDNARFIVQLVFNDVVLENVAIDATSQKIRVEISETLLIGNMGKRFNCQVLSYWNNVAGTGRSRPMRSDSYWLQIQVPSRVIDLNQPRGANDFTFNALSTLPFTCWHCANIADDNLRCQCCANKCDYHFQYSARFNDEKCALVLNNDNGFQKDFIAGSIDMQLHPDPRLNPNQNYLLSFLAYSQNKKQCPTSIWENYQLAPITIQTIAKIGVPLTCSAWNDPHIKNIFDTPNGVHNYLLGDFILASVYDPANKMYMMIQTRQYICNQNIAACTCAIIVREGNSVIGIDACINSGAGVDMTSVKIIRYLETKYETVKKTVRDGANIHRDPTGNIYTIVMASGLRVEVNGVSTITITFPPKYTAANIQGMCAWTDWPAHKGERYRVPRAESMFANPPGCLNWDFEPATECTCANGLTTCPNNPPLQPDRTGLTCTLIPSRRRRRQAPDGETQPEFESTVRDSSDNGDDLVDSKDVYYEYTYDPDHGKDINPTWPTANGKTEQEVEDHCRSVLKKSAVYDKCQGLYDEGTTMTSCKADVQMYDDLTLADPYMEIMQKQCIDTVAFEANATTLEELEQDPIYSDIANNICPAQCNQRGTCQNGKCICNEGFAAADCSVVESDPPTIIRINRNDTCDLSARRCGKLRVIASNTFDSPTLTCRFETFSLVNGQDIDFQSESFETQGSFYTFSQIDCSIPESKLGASIGYHVSISNDGVLFSNFKDFYVYDPACLTRTEDGTWQLKPGACMRYSRCYPEITPNCNYPPVETTPTPTTTTTETPLVESPMPSIPAIETETPIIVIEPTTTTQTTTALTSTAKPGETFNCDTNNPCTLKNIFLGKLFFPHTNPNQYVKCSLTGKCSIVRCLLGLVWNGLDNKCVWSLNISIGK